MRCYVEKAGLAAKLRAHAPRHYADRTWLARAAVAVVIRHGADLLLVERAERRGDRWSGHLAFPGGLAREDDADLVATATRETREEIGLDLEARAECIGRLGELLTLSHRGRPMAVTPIVFWLEQAQPITSSAEIVASFWLPLPEAVKARQRCSRARRALGWIAPRAGHAVGPSMLWGLSLMMLDELADRVSEVRG